MPTLRGRERVAGAASTALVPLQYPAFQEVLDITQRRVGRALLDLRPLGRGQLALEVAEKPVQHVSLAVVEGRASVFFPEARGLEHPGEDGLAERAAEARKEPCQPRGDVEIACLCGLENVVGGVPLAAGVGGQ